MTEDTENTISRRKALQKTGASAFALAGLPFMVDPVAADDDLWDCTLTMLDYVNGIITTDVVGIAATDLEELAECYPVPDDTDPDEIHDDYRWWAGGIVVNDLDPAKEANSTEQDEIYNTLHDLIDGDGDSKFCREPEYCDGR